MIAHNVSKNSDIIFQQDGSPYSNQFDDIYFDTESGCLQSERVFIQGNKIAEKLGQFSSTLVIGETGFGTGLNFLLTLALYQTLKAQGKSPAPIHFISTEKYPLTKAQLQQSLACLPQLAELSTLLINAYPETLEKTCDFSFFDNKIKLTILVGDSTESFRQLKVSTKGAHQGLVDAWYLDGFSPSKNPQMWQPALFEQLGRLSKAEASVATFTVAGIVRRGLTDNGFRVQRQSYGGKKKEILTGVFQQSVKFGKSYQLRPLSTKPQHVTIIGGGIASACAAWALVRKDIKVTLLCKDEEVAQGASSNHVGALYPLIHQTQDDISLFYQQALSHSREFYQSLLTQGQTFAHQWCGLLELSFNDKLKKRELGLSEKALWPKSLIRAVTAEQASEIAGIKLNNSGLFIENAGWIAPAELVNALFDSAKATGLLKVKTRVTVNSLTQNQDGKWLLDTNKGTLKASNLVVASGADKIEHHELNSLPTYPVRGQVSVMNTNDNISSLSTVICHKGYLTPKHHNKHCIGATFDKLSTNTQANEKSDQYNLAMLSESMKEDFGWSIPDIAESKARIRCMTPDHLPIVGPVAKTSDYPALYPHLAKDKNWRYEQPAPYLDNLYVLTGLGARGLCSAPLLADILVADLCGTPYPVNNNMLFNLSSNRFVIRDIIKRKV